MAWCRVCGVTGSGPAPRGGGVPVVGVSEAPLKRFVQDTPMYGLERVEGSIHDTRYV